MFPHPTVQCFQVREQQLSRQPNTSPAQQPLRQPNIKSPEQQLLRQPNIASPVQQPLRQPNITSPMQPPLRQPNITSPVQPPLRQPNITSPVQPPLRQPNITSPVQQTQPLKQPTTISPEQQKQPLLAQPNISREQQQQSLSKQGLQSPVQQEPSSLEVKPISGQPQKKPVSLPKTLWQRLHPEEDELSLLVKSHFDEKHQNSATKKKKLSAPRRLKLQTLQYSTDPLQGIAVLKEPAPTLALNQQSPHQLTQIMNEPTSTMFLQQNPHQLTPIINEPTPTPFLKQQSPHQLTPIMNEPTPTVFLQQNPHQLTPIMNEPTPTPLLKQQSPQQVIPIMTGQTPAQFLKQWSPLQTIPLWRQEQIDLQQTHTSEGPQPNSDTEALLKYLLQKIPITEPIRHSELLTKHTRQEPEESLLQMYSHFHEGTGDKDTQPKYIPKARLHTKTKKVDKRLKKLARMWRDNQRLRRLVKPRNAYSVLCELSPVTQRRVSVLPRRGYEQFTAVLSISGKQYQGTGLTRKEAKSVAAEEVLRLLMNKQMQLNDVADQNQEENIITISDSEDDEDSPISMKQLTSLALYKLFEAWKKMDTERSSTPLPAPAAADVDPLASLHPCDLLGRMRGSLPYNVLLKQATPRGMEFFIGLTVDGTTYVGKGPNKKEARYRAAKGACEAIFKVVYP